MRFIILPTLFFIVGCSSSKQIQHEPVQFANNIVVAHRGAFKKNSLPENSIASLKEAIRLGCTGSEFDVRMTADDSLIINHDPEFNKLPVEQTTYSALQAFKLSNGEKLPTLRQYILAGLQDNSATRLVCEIKPSTVSKERGKAIATKSIDLINFLQAAHMVVYISFDYDILKKIIEVQPGAITQYLNGDKSPEQLKADGISGADYHFSVFQKNPSWIQTAKQNNIALNAWTVNNVAEMHWLLANNFNFITTNEPELLFEQIKKSPTESGWKLLWSDEFNYTGLPDSTKWNYDVGGHGWGNNELQYYTQGDSNNARVADGKLSITARKKTVEKNEYTSARLVSKNKGDWLYGRIEVSAKLAGGRGMWPAIWMLPTDWAYDGWPASGEIDIMENVGYNPDTVFASVHTKTFNHSIGTQKTKGLKVNAAYRSFHLYAIEWSADKIDFFIDDNKFFSFENTRKGFAEWPFDKRFHLLLNVAVGGNWGGQKGIAENIFPATMEVDFVRVFHKQ